MNDAKTIADSAEPVSAGQLNSIELIKVVMQADEAMVGRCLRGTTNWAAAIGKAVQEAVVAASPPAKPFHGRVERHSDQSVLVAFGSCHEASVFERSLRAAPPVEDPAMQHLHNLLFTAQRTTGEQQALAINQARLVLHKLRAKKSAQAVCETCNDNGMIGGPSYYAPDEGGDPCPDCAQPPGATPDGEISIGVLRALWINRGGSFHGPSVETGTMPEAKLLPFLRELVRAQQPAGELSEPVAWESTTPAYTKYVTQSRYEKFSPAVRSWYKPFKCSACAAPPAQQPAPSAAAAEGWKLVPVKETQEMLTAVYNMVRPGTWLEVAQTVWRTMVEAAPQPSPTPQADSQPAPVSSDTLYLLRRLLSNQHTLTGSEFRAELEKIVGDAAQAADGGPEDAARLEALHAAVTAIYLDDSSDFKSALGAVVRHLDPKLAGDLLAWPKRAFDISQARLAAARKQGGA